MKEKKELSAFSLSKYTNFEMIMDSQFASVGAHQAKLLEKYEKNNKYDEFPKETSPGHFLKIIGLFGHFLLILPEPRIRNSLSVCSHPTSYI